MVGTALIAIVNLYGPGLQSVFATRPIPAMFWGPPFGFALGILVVDEVRKAIVRAYPKVRWRLLCALWRCADVMCDVVDRCKDGVVRYDGWR